MDNVLPAKKMQKKYGLYAENRPEIKLDKQKIPKDLHNLIPYAEKWGIRDDIIRADFEKKSSESDKAKLKNALKGHIKKTNEWLDTFNKKKMSNEASAFMYMLLAADEMGIYPKE